MVKRHINKMDFEALEVKMKKCKVSNTIDNRDYVNVVSIIYGKTVLYTTKLLHTIYDSKLT